MLLIDTFYQINRLNIQNKKKLANYRLLNHVKNIFKKTYKRLNKVIDVSYLNPRFVQIFLKRYWLPLGNVLNKKKYFLYLPLLSEKPKATMHIKSTDVNTYLTFSINGNVAYSKSAGAIGYKKKFRRVKVAAYKLGRDLAIKLALILKKYNIYSINIALDGYFRYTNAITSSIKRELSKYISESCKSVFFWRGRLRHWNRKKKNMELRFRQIYKPSRSQLRYEKYIEDQVRKYKVPVGGLRSVYDYTSPDHGGIKKRVRFADKRYW